MYIPKDFDYNPYSVVLIESFLDLDHEIEVCENLIWFHRYLYYIYNQAIISDDLYDKLDRRLKFLMSGRVLPKNSPLVKVGSSIPESYPKNIYDYFSHGNQWAPEYFYKKGK